MVPLTIRDMQEVLFYLSGILISLKIETCLHFFHLPLEVRNDGSSTL